MKKLIYLLIAISLLATFTACGKEEAQNSSEQSAEGVTSIESAEETSEESIVIEETEEESLSYEGTSDESEPPREEEPPYVQRYGYKPRSLYDMFTYVDDMWISADGETYEFVRISEQEKTESCHGSLS